MAYQKKKTQKKSPSKFRKYAKTAYKTVKGAATVASLARDVMIMKGLTSSIMAGLNVEKKYLDRDVATVGVGQVNANLPGWYGVDVTPTIAQGLGRDQRVGNSLKFTGMSFPYQINTQQSCGGNRKVKIMLFRVHSADNGVNIQEAIEDYYDLNPMNGIIDMNSPKAYRSHKQDGIRCIRSKTYYLKAPTINTMYNDDTFDGNERAVISGRFNVKLQDIVRYNQNGDTLPDGTRYYMYIFCDAGNTSGTTNSALDVPVVQSWSGVDIRFGQRSFWVDN